MPERVTLPEAHRALMATSEDETKDDGETAQQLLSSKILI